MKLTEPDSLTEMKIFLTELSALSDEQRTEIFRAVQLTRAAYAVPPPQRTNEENVLVQEHESWKTKENHE